MLPPIPQAEVNAQLADVGFTKSKAKGNGDCYPLSTMAGFEISATAARQPRAGTTASVRQVREAAVGILAGDAAVDGIDAAVFRDGEGLPVDADAARAAMAPAKEKSPPLVRRTGRKDARRPRVRPLPRVDDARARVDEDTRGSERSRAARARRYDRHARAVDATRG